MKFDNYMILDFPSKSANEAFARSAVACFAAQMDPTLEELGDIRTAVSEAVTNCIVHAYPEKLGNITLRIIEREEPKCIKFNLEGAPIQANLWIQLLERDTETLLKCTLGTELNFLLRQMVGNKIQDAANQLATTLAAIPY